jgi:acyl dehydratase
MTVERFPIEAGHVMMFARSIGDPNPVYVDDAYARASEVGAIIAPPTFVQASAQFDDDYPLRPKNGDRSGGGGGSGLHAEQHYVFHRPLRVGDVLTATTRPGERWEKIGRRAGKLVFAETITEFRDEQGELVVTARGVGVRTERVVES